MTENYSGLKNAYILIGKETTKGTKVSATKDVGIVTDINFNPENEVVKSRGMSSRSLDQQQMGDWLFKGEISCEFQHGRFLEYALGAVAHSGASDPYTHTFSEADTLPSFTAEVGLDGTTDDTETYVGCVVKELTLALDLKGVLLMRASVAAYDMETGTAASTAVTDTLPTLPWGVATFKTGVASSEVAVAQCRAFELTMATGSGEGDNDVRSFGSYKTDALLEGEQNYSGRVTLAFTDTNERSRFLSGATGNTVPATADFDGFSAILEVDRAADNRSVVVTMSDCHYSAYSKPISVGGVIIQEFTIDLRTVGIVSEDDIASADW